MDMTYKQGLRWFHVKAHERRAIQLVQSILDDLRRFDLQFTVSELSESMGEDGWFSVPTSKASETQTPTKHQIKAESLPLTTAQG